ncbi:prepilin-type N-terminal cleavage/methylation domain-containing protein [Candidatus Fervidibacteria bacterium JGI MDM2 JNZ-1-D12]
MRRKGLTLIELLIVSGPKNNYGCNGPPDGNYSCLTRSLQCL